MLTPRLEEQQVVAQHLVLVGGHHAARQGELVASLGALVRLEVEALQPLVLRHPLLAAHLLERERPQLLDEVLRLVRAEELLHQAGLRQLLLQNLQLSTP